MDKIRRADIQIGKRAYLEILRIFPTVTNAKDNLGCSKNVIYSWASGTAPSAKHLQAMAVMGMDVMYILTGKR